MERKLVQIGSSLAVTLPAEVVKDFKLKKGRSVEVSVHPVTGVVSINLGVKYVDGGKVTKRFKEAVRLTMDEFDDAFRELAK